MTKIVFYEFYRFYRIRRILFQVILKIEFFTIGDSVRLSDRSLHREEQKKL